MPTFVINKLVRDNIVEHILNDTKNIVECSELSHDEFVRLLKQKLAEEAQEVSEADGADMIEELADIEEIVSVLREVLAITPEQMNKARERKNAKNGAYITRTFLKTVVLHEDSSWIDMYRKKFIEIKDSA